MLPEATLASVKYTRLFKVPDESGVDPGTDYHHKIDSDLKSYNTILKKLIRQAKIQYYAEQFDKNKSNIRHTWSTIKEILNKCKNKRDFPSSFTINGQDIDDKYDIANQFNSFFASVGANISGGIINNGSKTVSSYLKQRIECSFQFECVGVSDVKKVIQNLASKNSSGHDGISVRFLKKILEIITPPLTHIINQSLCTGIFPDRLKIAKVIPLFKKGDQHVLDNYRVITMVRSDVHAKGQGQRSNVKVTEVNTQLSHYRTLTPVWIHTWQWNHAYSWKKHRRGAPIWVKFDDF